MVVGKKVLLKLSERRENPLIRMSCLASILNTFPKTDLSESPNWLENSPHWSPWWWSKKKFSVVSVSAAAVLVSDTNSSIMSIDIEDDDSSTISNDSNLRALPSSDLSLRLGFVSERWAILLPRRKAVARKDASIVLLLLLIFVVRLERRSEICIVPSLRCVLCAV